MEEEKTKNAVVEDTTQIEKGPQKSERRRVIDEMGDRMKGYEKAFSPKLDLTLPIIIRIDGHHFSSFVKGFKKPFDERIHKSMTATTEELLENFSACMGYTQSDEITLLFPEISEKTQTPLFNGKLIKICSLVAAYTTARFNYHMMQQTYGADEEHLQKKVNSQMSYFDARAFNVPSRSEALNNLLWRSSYDCRRNSVSMLAYSVFSSKALHGLGTTAVLQKLETEKNIFWDSYPPGFKYGSFVKKELYQKETVNPVTGEAVSVLRTRVVSKSLDLGKFSEANIALVFSKYWNEELKQTESTDPPSEEK